MTVPEANALLTELRSMAQLEPGPDKASLLRAKEICALLRHLDRRTVGERCDRAYAMLEILLSSRRWKVEATSVEALRKDIRMACDRLRVAVEAALHAARTA
jgi:hypothetical protein